MQPHYSELVLNCSLVVCYICYRSNSRLIRVKALTIKWVCYSIGKSANHYHYYYEDKAQIIPLKIFLSIFPA